MVLISAVTLIGAVGICIYFYLEIRKDQAYVNGVAGTIAEKGAYDSSLYAIRQTLSETKDERARLDALAVSIDGAAGFIALVEGQAHSAQVALEVGSVAVTPQSGVFDELDIAYKVEGTFANCIHFLKLIESLPYASSVGSIVLGKKDPKGSIWILTSSLSVPIHK